MQRIKTILQKTEALATDDAALIDIDLMLEYTRTLYAELLDLRKRTELRPEVPVAVEEPKTTQPEITKEDAPDESLEAPTPPPVEEASMDLEVPTTPVVPEPTISPVMPGTANPHNPDADIRRQIGINDKYLFISELFGNNKEAYDIVMERINGFETYNEAAAWLESQIQPAHHWIDDNDTVQSFYGLLSNFFASR